MASTKSMWVPDNLGPERLRLTRAAVVEAALEVLDEAGLDGLTTRRLAQRLGVRSASLYWHVRDKAQLLDLVAERIAAEIDIPDRTLPWRQRLDALVTSFRRVLMAHRDAALIMAQRTPRGPAWLAVADAAVSALMDTGRSPEEAAALIGVLVGYVTGFVLDTQNPTRSGAEGEASDYLAMLQALPADRFPALVRYARVLARPDPDTQFPYGVKFLLDALEEAPRASSG